MVMMPHLQNTVPDIDQTLLSVKVSFSVVLWVGWTSSKMLEALQDFTASRTNSNGTLGWNNAVI